jgi:hypothetical protein
LDWKKPNKYYNTTQFYVFIPLFLFFGFFIPSIAMLNKTRLYVEMQKDRLASCGTRRRSISQIQPTEVVPSDDVDEIPNEKVSETDFSVVLATAGLESYAEGLRAADLKWSLLKEYAAENACLSFVDQLLKEAGVTSIGHRLEMITLLRESGQ